MAVLQLFVASGRMISVLLFLCRTPERFGSMQSSFMKTILRKNVYFWRNQRFEELRGKTPSLLPSSSNPLYILRLADTESF